MKKNQNTRTEKDSLGQIEVPKDSYFGSFTSRAQNNFQISGATAPSIFREALGLVKLAAAETNASLGLLNNKQGKAIKQACKEFIDGKFNDNFTLDIFQAGAGTSYNMNANEIIANRANEVLKSPKGKYKYVHSNNHVNLAQSTNDVIPTTTRIAALLMLPSLLKELSNLEEELEKKAKEYAKTIKVGRTHGQDAVPINFGREFDAYKEALAKSGEFISRQSEDLQILGIGGTAVGTGITTHPKYKDLMIKNLSKIVGIQFKSAKNLTETTNNMNSFMNFSAALRSLATNLLNLCNDLKIMNMGPKAGLNEITIPPVQPGSSIMPGKVNPSIPECVEMICLQTLGNDKTIELAAQKSQFELNIFCPIIMHNLLQSMGILTNGLKTLQEQCVKGLKVNTEHVKNVLDNSLCAATSLTPHIGYARTAEVVKSALKKGITIKEEVLGKKLLKKKELEKILSED